MLLNGDSFEIFDEHGDQVYGGITVVEDLSHSVAVCPLCGGPISDSFAPCLHLPLTLQKCA